MKTRLFIDKYCSKVTEEGDENMYVEVGAVDFDGTLCEFAYPDIGKPYRPVIEKLIRFKEKGGKLILWTCREGLDLRAAVEWCKEQGLEFDAVNNNVDPEFCKKHNFAQKKIVAHWYLDDRNLTIEKFLFLKE